VNPIVGALIGPLTDLAAEFIEDKDKAAELAHRAATMASEQSHEAQMGQIEINKKEAEHPSVFVSGWRPFIGWVCGFAMLANFLILPVSVAVVAIYRGDYANAQIDLTEMWPVLLTLLGMGAYRTYERRAGVARIK